MKRLLIAACVAAAAASGCTAPSTPAAAGDTSVAVTQRQFFSQCPLAVAQPSVTLVTTTAAWQQMLATARTSPPPFDAAATAFDTQSVLIVATASTATPRTQLAVKNNAVTLSSPAQRLRVKVDVSTTAAQPAEMGVAVVGEPCLVLWLARVPGVKTVQADDAATGVLLVAAHLP
jgi:hypothetical protein